MPLGLQLDVLTLKSGRISKIILNFFGISFFNSLDMSVCVIKMTISAIERLPAGSTLVCFVRNRDRPRGNLKKYNILTKKGLRPYRKISVRSNVAELEADISERDRAVQKQRPTKQHLAGIQRLPKRIADCDELQTAAISTSG